MSVAYRQAPSRTERASRWVGAVAALALACGTADGTRPSSGVADEAAGGGDRSAASAGRAWAAEGESPESGPALPAEARTLLDRGNAAYRVGRFSEALQHYREAARRHPDVAAAWFGLYMAHQALGDAASAGEALARAHRLDPAAPLDASLGSHVRGAETGLPRP